MISNIISAFIFTLVIVCIQSSPPDAQLFRPVLLNQNGTLQKTEPRIVGGTPANLQNTSYQVSIRLRNYDTPFGSGHICGGSLISLNCVLTAAHCIYYKDQFGLTAKWQPNDFNIVMGTLILNQITGNTLQSRVSRYVTHEQFNFSTLVADIAVMFLITPVPSFHAAVRPIGMTFSNTPDNTTCQISGWGTIRYGGTALANTLLAARVQVLSYARCNQSYGGILRYGMMCAGAWNGTWDACQGDSGGPLACNNVLTGVISWGERCGVAGFPGIYTDVSYFQNWILKNGSDRLLQSSFLILNLIVLSIFYYF